MYTKFSHGYGGVLNSYDFLKQNVYYTQKGECTSSELTGNPNYHVKDAVIVHTTEELLEELKKYDEEEIFVIGGESVYRMMLPYCSKVYVTKIDHAYQADTYFPNLDQLEDWEMTEVSEEHTCFDLEYVFSTYERRQ